MMEIIRDCIFFSIQYEGPYIFHLNFHKLKGVLTMTWESVLNLHDGILNMQE